MRLVPVVPDSPASFTESTPQLYREGYEYYRTARAQHPNSPNRYAFSSLPLQIAYFPFDQLETISPGPLLVIAGSKADTLYLERGGPPEGQGAEGTLGCRRRHAHRHV